MYDPRHYRQPHLPIQEEDHGSRSKFNYAQVGLAREVGVLSTRMRVEVERYGGYSGVRIAHPSLSKSSGSVKFPVRDRGEETDIGHPVILALEGRPEDSVVLGYLDTRGDNELLKRITDYMKENPNDEFPWIDRHPSGVEIMYDGHGSWKLETPSGHTIKLIERDGEEAIEILTADDKPLTVRARGTGTVLLNSDEGNVEVLAGDTARLTGNNAEITAEEDAEITALENAGLSGTNVNILASEDVSIAATRDVDIGASGVISVLSDDVKMGIEALVKKLITEDFVALFNTHTHGGVTSGAGASGPPSLQVAESQVTTNNTKAS